MVRTINLTVERIEHSLEETVSKVHVANGVNGLLKFNAARILAVVVTPMVLNALHVPLVNNSDNFLSATPINGPIKILVSLVNEDPLHLREERVHGSNVPVHHVIIHALLRESLPTNLGGLNLIRSHLICPEGVHELEAFNPILENVEPRFVQESLSSVMVQFRSHEFELGAAALSLLARELHLDARPQRSEAEAEVPEIAEAVHLDAEPCHVFANGEHIIEHVLHIRVFVEVLIVVFELLL